MELINYAHRGASSYAPENTLAAFALAVDMKANGIETDVQRTKDGVLVLFHDGDLLRICGRPDAICDLTYAELLELDFGIYKGEEFRNTKITTLEEFLQNFAHLDLNFAIELKTRGIEKEVLDMIHKYNCYEKTIITSIIWQTLVDVHAIDSKMKLGYLAPVLNDQIIDMANEANLYQICPYAAKLTEEWNNKLRNEGFSVRPWGVDTEEIMKNMVALKVDGMTINFPDVLYKYLQD